MFHNMCGQIKVDFPERFANNANLDKIMAMTQSDDALSDLYTSHEKLGLPAVFCHGDFHGGNMMFGKDEATGNSTNEVLAVLDWQVCT